MLNDPLSDWLQLYGKSRGYIPRPEMDLYNKELDFVGFIFDKGREFEAGILRLLQEQYEVTTVALSHQEIRRLDKAHETYMAMCQGVPVIYQAVLWDAHHLTYGSPDFLVRSDILHCLFPDSISEQEAAASAPDLGDEAWHYRVVDTKFTTLPLNARGTELAQRRQRASVQSAIVHLQPHVGPTAGIRAARIVLAGQGMANDEQGRHISWYQRDGTAGPGPTIRDYHQQSPNRQCRGGGTGLGTPRTHGGQGLATAARAVRA